MNPPFKLGKYRPIYLWGGPGTIRMNKVKFMDYPVDEEAHNEVHTPAGARLVLDDLYCNWIHLMYDWGFPPEVEAEDWEHFRQGAQAYHELGSPVFAYIQSSNCVYSGSFIEKDWYARNPKGRKVYYYSGRYMTDWTHPDWIQHLKDLIKGALERGADGIFFDNMWYGEEPNGLMGAWLGGAGCYCERCRSLYRAEAGREIPEKIFPANQEVADYIRWRANRVTATIQELSDYVHTLKPDAPISANDYDVTMRNSYLIYGLDVEGLSKVQDVIMVENFALPRWDEMPKPRLANNALTIRNTRAFVRDQAHLSVLSYDVGIGFDPVYPPRRHQQGIGEAAACDASMTIKGTEYNNGTRMTMLTDRAYHAQHAAIGEYNRWLEAHFDLYEKRTNAAQIGLMHPEENLWRYWSELTAIYYGAGQTLTHAGLPWRVVRRGDSLEGLTALLTFSPEDHDYGSDTPNLNTLHIPDLPGWAWKELSSAAKPGIWHNLVDKVGLSLLNAYHSNKFTRHLMDRMNMVKLITQTTLFDLPPADAQMTLMAALPTDIYPRVTADEPDLIEIWKKGRTLQVHLVNYADKPQMVTVQFAAPVRIETLSPDSEESLILEGQTVSLELDIYTILLAK